MHCGRESATYRGRGPDVALLHNCEALHGTEWWSTLGSGAAESQTLHTLHVPLRRRLCRAARSARPASLQARTTQAPPQRRLSSRRCLPKLLRAHGTRLTLAGFLLFLSQTRDCRTQPRLACATRARPHNLNSLRHSAADVTCCPTGALVPKCKLPKLRLPRCLQHTGPLPCLALKTTGSHTSRSFIPIMTIHPNRHRASHLK